MRRPERKLSLFGLGAVAAFLLMALAAASTASDAGGQPAPGTAMAQQAVKSRRAWNTTDHAKHAALQQDFKSGAEITQACLSCHSEAESQFHKTIHFTWLADPADTVRRYGKAGYSLNNFCIGTNKGADKGCVSCHPGWGNDLETPVNCLVCHSRKKMNFDEAVTDLAAFLKEGDEASLEIAREIQAELKAAAQQIARPARENCGSCHFYGGGGDGVKHGDLDSSMANPNKALDVHMGVDGQDFQCTRCHTTVLHNVAGRVYTRPAATERKSLVQDDLASKITCESCHTDKPHKAGMKANDHTDKVACQSCHIPSFARVNPTKMLWDWSAAGKLKDGKKYKTKDAFGKFDYMTIKGQMKWEKNVQPVYLWYNGVIKSTTAKDPIDLTQRVKVSWPEGGPQDPNARIYPFKVHRGKQPYDKVNRTLLMPLLSGKDGYWNHLDWQKALAVGQEAVGLPYSGEYDFVETDYVFPITHMVAPKEQALACTDCHRKDGRLANLAGVYMPGRDTNDVIRHLGWAAVLASLLGVMVHGIGRIVANGRANGKKEG